MSEMWPALAQVSEAGLLQDVLDLYERALHTHASKRVQCERVHELLTELRRMLRLQRASL